MGNGELWGQLGLTVISALHIVAAVIGVCLTHHSLNLYRGFQELKGVFQRSAVAV